MDDGFAVVVSGPSGVGKSSLVLEMLQSKKVPEAFRVVTWTTRAIRPNEQPEVDYHFATEEEFCAMKQKDGFLESAFVHTANYGSPKAPVLESIREGRIPVLVVDVQGGLAIRKRLPEAVLVFVAPQTLEQLFARVQSAGLRRNDLAVRMVNAIWELRHAPFYNYVLVNDELGRAVSGFVSILEAEAMRSHRAKTPVIRLTNAMEEVRFEEWRGRS